MSPSCHPPVRWPAEWEPVEAVWLSWPLRGDLWAGGLDALQDGFAGLAAAIAPEAVVRVNAVGRAHDAIRVRCAAAGVPGDRLELFDHPTDDVWCRDHGAIFVRRIKDGDLVATDWRFNAWGGKFPPWDQDDQVARRMAESLGLPCVSSDMILEGGAIEGNGAGLLLTTEAVLLNPNRNPDWGREAIEAELRRMLGVGSVFWLSRGLEGDDTDGHVDDLTRFVAEDAVVTMVEPDGADPNHRVLAENRERLRDLRTAAGSRVEIVDLPMPGPVRPPDPDWRLDRLPASYANFLVCNRRVLAPVFGQPRADDRALGILRECFPGREVVGIDARRFLVEGGAVHCLTQQQPAACPPVHRHEDAGGRT